MLILPVLHALYKGGSCSSLTTVSRMDCLVVASKEDRISSTLVTSLLAIAVISVLDSSKMEIERELYFRMPNIGEIICSIHHLSLNNAVITPSSTFLPPASSNDWDEEVGGGSGCALSKCC